MTNVYLNLKFSVWNYHIPFASEKMIMVEVSGHTSERVMLK